jgi:lipopolysaccharide export LptBFGC system permease protein LptF
MSTIYQINKGVNRPMVFQGLQGQYIAWLALGLVFMLLGFAIGYMAGIPAYVLLPLVLGIGGFLFWALATLSKRFGAHGMEKFLAARNLPKTVVFRSRRVFTSLRRKSILSSTQGHKR